MMDSPSWMPKGASHSLVSVGKGIASPINSHFVLYLGPRLPMDTFSTALGQRSMDEDGSVQQAVTSVCRSLLGPSEMPLSVFRSKAASSARKEIKPCTKKRQRRWALQGNYMSSTGRRGAQHQG